MKPTMEFRSHEITEDYTGDLKTGGQRPLVARLTIQNSEPYSNTLRVTLTPRRLEKLLSYFERLAIEQLHEDTRRDDDALLGRRDIIVEPDDPIALLKDLIDEDGPQPGRAAWAERVRRTIDAIAKKDSEAEAE